MKDAENGKGPGILTLWLCVFFCLCFFSIRESKTAIRNQFSFDPTEGIVMKDGYQLINVSINAQLLGAFEEEFKFESCEPFLADDFYLFDDYLKLRLSE